MNPREPNLVHSGLSRTVEKDGVTVEVSIVRLEHESNWSLEVVNAAGTSIVWEDLFSSDDEAYAEFEKTVAEEGMRAFFDTENVIPPDAEYIQTEQLTVGATAEPLSANTIPETGGFLDLPHHEANLALTDTPTCAFIRNSPGQYVARAGKLGRVRQ